MKEGAAAEGFAEVACKGADVSAFAAVYQDLRLRQPLRHFCNVDSAGCCRFAVAIITGKVFPLRDVTPAVR